MIGDAFGLFADAISLETESEASRAHEQEAGLNHRRATNEEQNRRND
jgi:hypothetical protein